MRKKWISILIFLASIFIFIYAKPVYAFEDKDGINVITYQDDEIIEGYYETTVNTDKTLEFIEKDEEASISSVLQSGASITSSKNFYYNQITSDIGKSVYNSLKGDTTGRGSVEVTINKTFSYKNTNIDNIKNQKIYSYAYDGLMAFIDDNPLIYWYYGPTFTCHYTDNKSAKTITVTKLDIKSNISERNNYKTFNNKVNQISDSISYEQEYYGLKQMHDYICKNVTYEKQEDTYIDQTAYDALMNKKGVCEAQAKLFKVLCDKKNIPCIVVNGYAGYTDGEKVAHEWNYVYSSTKGKWYAFDVTWDNQKDKTKSIKYDYFFVGSNSKINNYYFSKSHIEGHKVYEKQTYIPTVPEISETNIDEKAPTINKTITPNNWTNGNVILTIDATDDLSGIKEYSLNAGGTWNTSLPVSKTVSKNTCVVVYVKDNAGNIGGEFVDITNIDKEKPTIKSVTGNSSNWTKDDITLTINAEDNLSGLADKPYSFDGGATWQKENTKLYSQNTSGIEIKVKDNAENVSTYSEIINITSIDKEKPTIKSVTGNSSNWTKDDITLTINAEDNLSGLADKPYSFDRGATWQKENTKTYSQNTSGIEIQVKDNTGNISTYSEVINITKILKLTGIRASTEKNYYVGDTIKPEEIEVKAIYNNGIMEEKITEGFDYTPKTLNKEGSQEITVTYGGKETSFTVNVQKVEITGIEIKELPTKRSYYVGDNIDVAGLKLRVTYNDGRREDVTSGYTYSPTKLDKDGTQTIIVRYRGKETSFTVNVQKVETTGIEIKELPTKRSYYVGDNIDVAGLKLRVTYNDGTKEDVASGYTCLPTELNKEGTQTITVTYGGKETSFEVNVQKIELTGIEITTMPTKTTYIEGDTFSKEGMKVTARYNDSRKDKVLADNSYTIIPNRALTMNDKKVTISYTENGITKTAMQNIIVNQKTTPISDSKEYKLGDTNEDGKIDFKDMLAINKHRLKKTLLTGESLKAADVNKDGEVDFKDMLKINKYRLGKINSL